MMRYQAVMIKRNMERAECFLEVSSVCAALLDESEVNVGNEFGQKVTGACQEIVREHYMQQFCKSSGPARCTTRIRLNDMTPFYSPPRSLMKRIIP
jgi:hypothetical protein